MAKKARSKYMTEILSRITQEFDQIKMVIFPEEIIMNEPVENWPHCDALISFYSGRFPLEKAVLYAKLRRPFLVNDLEMQFAIQNRWVALHLDCTLFLKNIHPPKNQILLRKFVLACK